MIPLPFRRHPTSGASFFRVIVNPLMALTADSNPMRRVIEQITDAPAAMVNVCRREVPKDCAPRIRLEEFTPQIGVNAHLRLHPARHAYAPALAGFLGDALDLSPKRQWSFDGAAL